MKLKFNRFWLALSMAVFAHSQAAMAAEGKTLTLAAYDSLMSKGGWGEWLVDRFKKQCDCDVRVVTVGDAGALVTRFQIESKRKKAEIDVYLGVDQNLLPAIEKDSAVIDSRLRHVRVKSERFLPFDWGEYRFLARDEAMKKEKLADPVSVFDLELGAYRKSFVLEDPRTSTPGLAFVAFVESQARSQRKKPAYTQDWWKAMRSQWLTLAPSWDSAYGLFLKGEAPLVWTYSSSLAYHVAHGEKGYRLIQLKEGAPVQIEGAVVSSRRMSENRKLIESFLEFAVSKDAQAEVAERNWMFPVRADVALPASFRGLERPDASRIEFLSEGTVRVMLEQWRKAVF